MDQKDRVLIDFRRFTALCTVSDLQVPFDFDHPVFDSDIGYIDFEGWMVTFSHRTDIFTRHKAYVKGELQIEIMEIAKACSM